MDTETAITLFNQAAAHAREAKLPWEGSIALSPHPDLIELVRRSQENTAQSEPEEGE
jgi:hypothetical protein